MESTWNLCGISIDDLLVQPKMDNISKLDGTTIMIIILFIVNTFSLTLSLKNSINTNVKKTVFKKPVEKENKDVEIQTEEYAEPILTRPTKIRQKQAMLLTQ